MLAATLFCLSIASSQWVPVPVYEQDLPSYDFSEITDEIQFCNSNLDTYSIDALWVEPEDSFEKVLNQVNQYLESKI